MFRSNTDVTVITGNSIADSMYVCHYAVKADKYTLFGDRALRKIRNLPDGMSDDRRLLGSIARGSEGVRTVGGQEAVDNLLTNPLTFQSADKFDVNINFLMEQEGALTLEQCVDWEAQAYNVRTSNIFEHLDDDEGAAVCNSQSRGKTSTSHYMHPFVQHHMQRPVELESLSASQFYSQFSVKKVRADHIHLYAQTLLLQQQDTSKKGIESTPEISAQKQTTSHSHFKCT